MATASRDLTTVDLRGLKPHLARLAATRGVTLSAVIRELLAGAAQIGQPQSQTTKPQQPPGARVRVSLRLTGDVATALAAGARAEGLSVGDYVGGLQAQVPALQGGPGRGEHLRELAASTAELATLSRSIRHLNELVEAKLFAAASEYAGVIASLDDEVRRHLRLASRALSDLQPRRPGGLSTHASTRKMRG